MNVRDKHTSLLHCVMNYRDKKVYRIASVIRHGAVGLVRPSYTIFKRRHDIQHNDNQRKDIQHNNEKRNTQHNVSVVITAEFCKAECRLCCVSQMLSVANKPFMLCVFMLNVVLQECRGAF